MPTARVIIGGALTFRLNRLSPGETLDPDLAATCIAGLNDVVDSMNGGDSFLFRQIFTPGVCNGTLGTLGTTWAGLNPGTAIIGATVSYAAGQDLPIDPLTLEQYQQIAQKATASIPQFYAPDGASTVFLWPAAAGQTITLLTEQNASAFADLDTVYTMPDGYQSFFSAQLAEKMAPTLNPGMLAQCAAEAKASRNRMAAQNLLPAIVNATTRTSGNILSGWNR